MNAITFAPNRKTTKRIPALQAVEAVAAPITAEAPPTTIEDIRRWICMAEEKIEMAYDSAERGEPIDMLLDHINHDVIVTPSE